MKIRQSSGFTLIEVVIVLLIGGILLASFGSGLLIYFNNTKVSASKEKLERINETLVEYLAINQKLPCPADTTATVDSANFGREVDALPVSTVDCDTGGNRNGTIVVSGARNVNGGAQEVVRIGSVPTRALNLPDEFMYDSYGSRFLYAVSAELATDAAGYNPNNGVIDVQDSGGNSLLNNPLSPPAPQGQNAHYVLLSHGPDQQGGITVDGVTIEACPASAATGGFDVENCDNNDAIFLRTILSTENLGATQFDDQVLYNSFDAQIDIPANAVVAFNGACPTDGWAEWTPAYGRFIIGAGGTYVPTVGSDANPNDGTVTWVEPTPAYVSGTQGGSVNYRMAPTEMPSHDHNVSVQLHQSVAANNASTSTVSGGSSSSGVIGSRDAVETPMGGTTAMQYIPPYLALTYCIKLP